MLRGGEGGALVGLCVTAYLGERVAGLWRRRCRASCEILIHTVKCEAASFIYRRRRLKPH